MFISLPSTVLEMDRPAPGRRVTLLCIEDTLSNLQLLKLVVDSMRPAWRLLAAQDGRDGLRQARDQHPDLIVLNLQLLGMGGEVVLAELRRQPATARIPVLILSGDASRRTHDQLVGLGADDYLLKPFNVDDLVAKLEALRQTDCG